MSQVFAYQLGLTIQKTNIRTQKINGTTQKTYKMVVSIFFMLNKDSKERFFEKSFLLTDIKPKIVLGMLFQTMSNADIDFQVRNLQWRFYTTGDLFSTTRQVKLIEKIEFTAIVLDLEYKAFVIHVAALSVNQEDEVHSSKKAQIAYLKADKAFTKVLSK